MSLINNLVNYSYNSILIKKIISKIKSIIYGVYNSVFENYDPESFQYLLNILTYSLIASIIVYGDVMLFEGIYSIMYNIDIAYSRIIQFLFNELQRDFIVDHDVSRHVSNEAQLVQNYFNDNINSLSKKDTGIKLAIIFLCSCAAVTNLLMFASK